MHIAAPATVMDVFFRAAGLFLLLISSAMADDPSGEYCDNSKNLTNSQQNNVEVMLPQLATNVGIDRYVQSTSLNGSESIYAHAQCRGDVPAVNCSACVSDAALRLLRSCSGRSAGAIWFEYCTVRYDTRNFIGQVDTGTGVLLRNTQNFTDLPLFNHTLSALMQTVEKRALQLNHRGFGSGIANVTLFSTLHAMVQCTGDLALQTQCAQCLAIAISNFDGFCKYSMGCRVLYPSCYLRYELYPFEFPSPSVDPPVIA